MNLQRKRRCVLIGLLLITFLSFLVGSIDKASIKEAVNGEIVYVNKTDGYQYNLPEGFSIDEEFMPYAVRFLSDKCAIEIYAERCNNQDEVLGYINYTNCAVTSDKDNYFDVKQIEVAGITVLSWNRYKLSKIKNDKNYYIKIDIPTKKMVYTILIKSSFKIEDYSSYIESFKVIKLSKPKEIAPKIKYASNRKFNAETETFYNKYFRNSQKVEWGIYQYDYLETHELKKIESRIDHKFKLLLLYSEFNEKYDYQQVRAFLDKAYSENRVVELTLQPKKYHQQGNELFRVLDGYYDEFLHAYAKDVADFSHPVLFRFGNEMNGDWCEYSGYRMSLDTELYREMYRYIYNIFEEHNTRNVIWVWNPNGKSFPDFNWNSEEMYYPGNEYVDVLGLTLYNTGNFYDGEEWTEFSKLYTPLYKKAMKQYDMPFMITEFSCARKGGNKEKWTEQMLSEIEKFPNIKFAVWWNGADFTPDAALARSYYINDSEEMYEVFKEYFESN